MLYICIFLFHQNMNIIRNNIQLYDHSCLPLSQASGSFPCVPRCWQRKIKFKSKSKMQPEKLRNVWWKLVPLSLQQQASAKYDHVNSWDHAKCSHNSTRHKNVMHLDNINGFVNYLRTFYICGCVCVCACNCVHDRYNLFVDKEM